MNLTAEQVISAYRTTNEAILDSLPKGLERVIDEFSWDDNLDSPKLKAHIEKVLAEGPAVEVAQSAIVAVAPAESTEQYDLLPFELYNPRLEISQPADGYQIDQWNRPHGFEGARRKRGPLSKYNFWRKTGQGKRQFFHGYRLTIGGKRKWVTDRSLALARFNAVRKREGRGEYI